MKRVVELETKPIGMLMDEEWSVLTVGYLIMDARKGSERLSLRDYSIDKWMTPSRLLKLIRPYMKLLDEELRKLGYARVSKYSWRKWEMKIPLDRIREVARELKLSEREAYVLYVAWKLLNITYPFKIDWKGYNFFHAFAVLDRLCKPKTEFSREDIEWIRQRLIKYYRDQILGLGLDLKRLEGVEGES